jgi:hypothetical protein
MKRKSTTFYRLEDKYGGITFVHARNLKHLKSKAGNQVRTADVVKVERINAAGTGYIKVKNPFKR